MVKRPQRKSAPTWPVLDDQTIHSFVFQTFGHTRRTQDSPIGADVWLMLIRLAERAARTRHEAGDAARRVPSETVDVLITPWNGASPGEIAAYLHEGALDRADVRTEAIAQSGGYVVARVDLGALILLIVPMTAWWQSFPERFWAAETRYISFVDLKKSADTVPQVLRKSSNQAIEYFRFAAIAGFVRALGEADVVRATELIEVIRKFAALSLRGPIETVEGTPVPPVETAAPPPRGLPTARDLAMLIEPFQFAYSGEIEGYIVKESDLEPQASNPKRDDATDRPKRKALQQPHVFSVSQNRPAAPMLVDSRRTVKADAAVRLFDISASAIVFAVIDGGIDATHPGFLDWSTPDLARQIDTAIALDRSMGHAADPVDYGPEEKRVRLAWSRITKTYDFTRLRAIQIAARNMAAGRIDGFPVSAAVQKIVADPAFRTNIDHLNVRSDNARELDWDIIEPLISVRHDDPQGYVAPEAGHGTHVAGILAADLKEPQDIRTPLQGICPNLKLYDLRVFDANGQSDEFTILSAVEFVGWLNRSRDHPVVHGVNMSLALRHYVDSYACGGTPICEACNKLVGAGTVVVAAAGNTGFDSEANQQSLGSGYRSITITDPGNAAGVITVGSTHRRDPHAYGVSYFSSRGPTGDGRRKPDLVAPGEKITSLVPGGKTERMDGTSMAAPHVSGAAALLMARYPELIGQPGQIKDILIKTATDLGREHDFQGAGLVDVLRALQSV